MEIPKILCHMQSDFLRRCTFFDLPDHRRRKDRPDRGSNPGLPKAGMGAFHYATQPVVGGITNSNTNYRTFLLRGFPLPTYSVPRQLVAKQNSYRQ
jgi:hypothetical protein